MIPSKMGYHRFSGGFFLFLSTFGLVLMLGLQSLFVNHFAYGFAMLNSLGISAAQLFLLKSAPKKQSGVEFLAYFAGGPLGVACAMFIYQYWI